MKMRIYSVALAALAIAPGVATSQQATMAAASANPVSDAFRNYAKTSAKNLIAAADAFPADKFAYKPTPAQMSVADIAVHLAQGNDYLCGTIGGMKAPERAKVAATDSKENLMARLRETFAFCDQALASVTDATMGEELPFFGGRKMTRAAIVTLTTGDWADHYSQYANYLRLNGMLPPTANRSAGQ
jgi:uncharacterized damage-inducible protein DinB